MVGTVYNKILLQQALCQTLGSTSRSPVVVLWVHKLMCMCMTPWACLQRDAVGEASGSVDDPEADMNLEPGRQHVFCAWVHADRAGNLRVCCHLEYQAAGLVTSHPSAVAL